MKQLLLLLSLFMFSCKTVHFERKEVLKRENEISALKEGVDSAMADDVDFLAPKHFKEANDLLDKAISEAQKSSDPQAGIATARSGLEVLAQARGVAKDTQQNLGEAFEARTKAQDAQADRLFESDFHKYSEKLAKAAELIEAGEKRKGFEQNAELARLFSELEVKALKANLAGVAEKAYDDAVKAGAEKHAPVTLKKAKAELEVAKRIVDIEKGNYEQARDRAEEARYLARRAEYISNLVVGFKKEKLTDEEIILWYQDQLALIHQPLPTTIRFDMDNKNVVNGFLGELTRNKEHVASLESQAVNCEKKTAKLSDKFEAKMASTEAKEGTFRDVSALFSADEAEVLKRGNDVIIRLHGFSFNVGKSDILPENFSLLNKIAVAIVKYPKALIEVEGHTDITGSKSKNMQVSTDRAKNVAEFLVKVAGIESTRVKSIGVGSIRPVFSNTTEENKAKNRRIEVIILNQ